ncbi:uncharacterized protein N7477_007687 [Penicillium maclennaniae]|uniref:uncharacterized protein n=1 Tax=Penicillium maclennaniae TaxID=1343394 RepID=UPI00254141F9|nr:uncharacterized protein N7477_007687 [Penicillium maclennaniae]KAJ5665239.1 hypothetical protein N7477_007687 [Penicillium maclennaniae]
MAGETSRDLGFVEGDLIECLNAGDGQWWMGRLRRDRRAVGLFPSNFVELMSEDFVPSRAQYQQHHLVTGVDCSKCEAFAHPCFCGQKPKSIVAPNFSIVPAVISGCIPSRVSSRLNGAGSFALYYDSSRQYLLFTPNIPGSVTNVLARARSVATSPSASSTSRGYYSATFQVPATSPALALSTNIHVPTNAFAAAKHSSTIAVCSALHAPTVTLSSALRASTIALSPTIYSSTIILFPAIHASSNLLASASNALSGTFPASPDAPSPAPNTLPTATDAPPYTFSSAADAPIAMSSALPTASRAHPKTVKIPQAFGYE